MEKLTDDYIRTSAARQAQTAARELESLALWAGKLAADVRKAPHIGYTVNSGASQLADIQARLSKADALFSLLEKD